MTKSKQLAESLAETVSAVSRETVTIKKANLKVVEIKIVGTAPYCQNKFGKKAREEMEARQRAGSTAIKGKKRDSKDFELLYQQALHVGADGKYGIPATAFRAACISACRLVGFKMTLAKLSVFIIADTFDADDMTPLVHIEGAPQMHIAPARNDNGSIDLRARAVWAPGWRASVMVQFDADQFTLTDIYNLFERVGTQVGVGEGRNDSRDSCGIGWGSFQIEA
jgi:hypothetical protein